MGGNHNDRDLMMLKCQKQFFFVMGVVGLMFLVIYDNPTLVFGYLTIMFSFIPLTTLAYDDADNGSAYLFTLPVSRKGYLVEKYLFSAGFILAAAFLTLAVVIVACLVKNYAVQPEELGVMVMTCITVSVIFSAVSMPVQLKFGSERSRVAAALTFGGLFGIFLPCACGIMVARGAIRQNSVGVRPALFCGMNMRKEETNGSLYKFCRSI